MTPGEEVIMTIYEDGIYCPPDMIEKPVDLEIKGSGTKSMKQKEDTTDAACPSI